MKILYTDESGHDSSGKGTTSHFILLGFMIDAADWKPLDQDLSNIKRQFSLEDVEIHAAWMARRYQEQESIPNFNSLTYDERRSGVSQKIKSRAGVLGVQGKSAKIKAYRKYSKSIEAYIHLSHQERLDCLHALASKIGQWETSRIFAEAICKSDYASKQPPYEQAFEQVLTRYQAFLSNRHDIGIVVHDNNETVSRKLTDLSRRFHVQGTLYRKIDNIVETPLFVDSSLTSMIQMADLCAYSLRRFIEKGETTLWDLVKSRVDQVNGIYVGLRHFTGKRDCGCSICVAHNRKRSSLF